MSAITNTPTGRAKSCVACRQFKLACDARRTAPDPCSRCVDRDLQCRFDPNFKRVSTRRITKEVTEELHALRRDVLQPHDSDVKPSTREGHSPVAADHSTRSVSSASSTFRPPNMDAKSSTQTWLRLAPDEYVLDRSLYGLSLSSNKILKLFYFFDQSFYPHARFLKPLSSINNLAEKFPFLFWTILLVSADRWPEETGSGLYHQLCAVNDALMVDVLHRAIQELETVHALLLLCLWPIPKLRNAHDPSWNYIGLCVQAAQSLDCHHPQPPHSPMKHYRGWNDTPAADMDPAIQAMTWLECFLTGARLGTTLGFIGPVSLPQHTKSVQRARALASSILTFNQTAQLDLWQILVSAQGTLSDVSDWSLHYATTQMFENQIQDIHRQYQQHWSLELEIQMQAVTMYLLGMTLTLDLPNDNEGPQAAIFKHLALERSMQAAQDLISAMTSLSDQEIPGQRNSPRTLFAHPKHFFIMLVAATTYLFRFLASYQGATQSVQALAITRITQAHRILQSFPEHRDAVRACITIETLIDRLKLGNLQELQELAIKTRLGASIVSDAVFRAAECRQKRSASLDPTSQASGKWKMIHEDSINAARLPLAPLQRIATSSGGGTGSPSNSLPFAPTSVPDLSVMGIWDAYSNDFSMMNEPWISDDAEFALMQPPSFPIVPTFEMTGFHEGLDLNSATNRGLHAAGT